MSLATVKIELSNRNGRYLLPSFFPIDLLIAVIRELTIAFDRGMTEDEITEFAIVLRPYIRKLIAMQDESWLASYDENAKELFPKICVKFYEHASDELISKLTEYNRPRSSLVEKFGEILDYEGSQ